MSWLSILTGLLTLANTIASFIRQKDIKQSAQSELFAKQLSALSLQLGVAKRVKDRIASLSDAAITDELSAHGELRD